MPQGFKIVAFFVVQPTSLLARPVLSGMSVLFHLICIQVNARPVFKAF